MSLRCALVLVLCAPAAWCETAARLGAELRQSSLDSDACYRVRDLQFQRGDARFYLTDGYLLFGKPVGGRVISAVFQATESTDDGEVLLRPPDRGERASLAVFTGSPNLNEHFRQAVFVFTDATADELLAQIRENPLSKPVPDMGLVLGSRLGGAARNLGSSFQVRIVLDLLAGAGEQGMFYAALNGVKLGNFDILHDPMSLEPITVGQVASRGNEVGFDVWTSFQTRALQRAGGGRQIQDGRLEDYRIEASVQPDLTLSAITRVAWTPSREIRGALGFELAPEMALSSVKLDGNEVEVFRHESMRAALIGGRGNEPFLVVLPEPMRPGRRYELEFHHAGRVIRAAGNNVYFVGARLSWYPSRGLNHSLFDMTFRVPRELNVVATGDLVEEREEGFWRVVRRRTPAPVRLAGFNLGIYERVSASKAGLTVEVFANRQTEAALVPRPHAIVLPAPVWQPRGSPRRTEIISMPAPPPPNPRARMAALADEVSSAMEWMSEHFGPPPLTTLTVSPIPGFFGQGFPGLLYLSTLAFLAEQERPGVARGDSMETFYNEILHAHETAHQWWGNLVAAATYRDDWIQEALANYTALLILERKKGSKALENVLAEYLTHLRQPGPQGRPVESAGPITWGLRLTGDRPFDAWRVITYDKGSWIMHMLRRRVGDEAFLKMLGTLRARYEFKTLSTGQFRELAAGFIPKGTPDADLENFFDHWVYGTGIPTLELSHAVKGKAPKRTLTVTVKQSGVADDFGIDLPVEIRLPGRKTPLVRWVRTAGEPVSFTIPVPAAPSRVELAPGMGVLAVRGR